MSKTQTSSELVLGDGGQSEGDGTISLWYVYILKCRDGTYYTGSTNDLNRRVEQHNAGKGAKYTKSHGPVELIYSEILLTRSLALKRECKIKSFTRSQKIELINSSDRKEL